MRRPITPKVGSISARAAKCGSSIFRPEPATTGSRWTETTLDGLGRAVKVERGYGTTTVSVTETEYGPCACSPLGKVKKVSQPYAQGGTKYWTEYTWDALGRTLSVIHPGNTGTTTYVYDGIKIV